MTVKAFVVVLGLGVAVPAAAQQRDSNQQVADQQQATQKTQMRSYEVILRLAVERGGQEFASWTNQVVPGLMLAPVSPPLVSSVPTLNGIVFDIQIPEIIGTQIVQQVIGRQPQQTVPTLPATTTQPTTTPGKVTGSSVQMPDKGTPGNASAGASPSLNANDRYSEYVRSALLDAILDNIGVLTLKDDDIVTIAAMGIDVANTNPFYANNSRKLILHVKGADLNLARQGKISRDELRDRIIEKRF